VIPRAAGARLPTPHRGRRHRSHTLVALDSLADARDRDRWPGDGPTSAISPPRIAAAVHSKASVVIVARPTLPPLSGLILNCKWLIPSPLIDHSSCSSVVPGGLKLYSWRTIS
jgi:hypothetical protein